jgi:hypothetical protein
VNDFLRAVDTPTETADTPQAAPADGPSTQAASAPRRMRPKRPVPTDRMKVDTQKEALAAIGIASRGGEQAVTAADIAVRLNIIEATARLNNVFFAEAGWIDRTGKGRYMPTDPVIKYAQQRGFNETAAAALLAPAISRSWYFTEIEPELRLGRPVPADRLVAILAQSAGATSDYKTQLEMILTWLEYVGLIVVTEGQVQLGQRDLQDLQREHDVAGDEGAGGGGGAHPAGAEGEGTTTKDQKRVGGGRKEAPLLSLNFDLALTAADLKELDPEQIRAIFDAVGKIAAIKAGRE